MSPNWRWRKCPNCAQVERASDFQLVGNYGLGWDGGQASRECPNCGYQAATRAFAIVREYHGHTVVAPLAAPTNTAMGGS